MEVQTISELEEFSRILLNFEVGEVWNTSTRRRMA